MASPPKRMTRGFDRTLANVLEVTPTVLFVDYKLMPPEVFRRDEPDSSPPGIPWNHAAWHGMTRGERAGRIAEMLDGDAADGWLRIGIQLVASFNPEMRKQKAKSQSDTGDSTQRRGRRRIQKD